MKLQVNLGANSYPITIAYNALTNIKETINVNRKVAIITDTGVPTKWVDMLASQCPNHFVLTFEQGEQSKCFDTYKYLLEQCIEHNMSRKDCIIAIGGGVVGDLSGFVAASYMRGIDFYNIPTTILSQVDSSVGGKVAIDMGSYKNIVGAFWQPKAVIIDPQVLSTLSLRQQHNGLFEALKMGLILDPELFEYFEQESLDLEKIIQKSISLKKMVVEQDEKESSLRKILNFGHTIGHAIESNSGLNVYLHGECVSMGMLFFIEDKALKERVLKVYEKLEAPKVPEYSTEVILDIISHDKKTSGSTTTVVKVPTLGKYTLEEYTVEQLRTVLERGPYEE